MDDLHALPKVRDGLTHLYVEHARVDRHQKSIAIWGVEGMTPVPAASLAVLMLGPGTTVTHAAIQTLADNNCLLIWCGEENVRFYAQGMGGTRSAAPLLQQSRLAADEVLRMEVVKRMYRKRFTDLPAHSAQMNVEQWRGLEGIRVRRSYAEWSEKTGVEWTGRIYDRNDWAMADPVNRALSCANSCLYGLCHAAILAAGYSPGIGFIHTGKQLSFVYDIADLYKTEVSLPVAFTIAQDPPPGLERAVRQMCRDRFRESRLLQRLIPDIQRILDLRDDPALADFFDNDPALPSGLWQPTAEGGGVAPGGVNHADLLTEDDEDEPGEDKSIQGEETP